MLMGLLSIAQGSRLSIQSTGPKKLSVCGINDSAFVEVYNISSGTVTGITVKLNLPPGIRYVKSTLSGTGMTEGNISNLNQPEFKAPDLSIAKNVKFRVLLTADCDLLTYINGSNTPAIQVRATYTGNFDVGNSIPFQVKVPSAQFGTILNLSFTGDIGSRFSRTITIGNYGQGPLREIKLSRINGKDLQTFFVNKGNTVYKGDTVITTFNAAFFKTIGNLDTLLDQNETITLIDSNLIKGCRFMNTAFELSWGCNGKNCQVSKTSGSALISNKSPVLKALPFPVTPTCYDKHNYKTEIRFVNTGNMTAITPRFSISLNYPYVMSTFDTASIRIKVGYKGNWSKVAKDSTTATYNLGYYGCVGLYPIGFFRIKGPDMKPNDTVFITWNTESCTVPDCSNASMLVNCWAYHADYKDQCKNNKVIPWTWGKVYDQHYFNSSSFIPTDMINNQTGEFRTLISSASMFPRTSNARYVVDLILPKGLVHSKQKKDLYFINADLTANWNPDSLVQKGDTLRAYFPHPVPISFTNAELVYYLKADCSKAGANGNQTIKLQIRYLPDRNCNPNEWLYLTCQSFQVKIHCVSNCNGGMKFRNFQVQRINFGKPDNNNDGLPDASGSLDTLKVREERCFFGDTIQAVYTGTVKRTSTIITWRNAYIETTVTNGKPLNVAGIQLLVWRRGVTLSLNCSQIKSWKTVSGNNATFKIDLSTDSMPNCVSSGFRYSADDSLVVKVKFRVGTNIGGTTQNILFNNRFYTSNVNNPTSNANKFQCDTFSGQMIMTGYYFTTCCNDVYQLNSCNQLAVNNYFYMGIGPCCSNYGGNNYFPYEYRNFARLKAVRYYLPQGFKMGNSQFAQYRTSGSNKTTWELKDSIKAVNNNAYPLVYDLAPYYKDSAKGNVNFSDDAFHGYYQAFINPSCEIQSLGSIPVKYDFIFERRNTMGGGFDTVSSGNADQIIYNKPVTAVKASSPVIYAAQDTAEWELVYTNYSPTFSNVNTWFAPDNSGAVKIVQIKDAAKDTLLPASNAVFRAGTIPFNQTRKFKIRAIYNTCKKDSVVLFTGWNCQGYPKDLSSYNCLKERIVLYIEPQNTQYQSTLTDSIKTADLCATTPYSLTVENTGATTGYNTRAYVNLPIGMTVVSGSCYLEYPAGSGKTAIPLPTLKSGTTYEWNLAGINSTIAAGFKGISDIKKNKIVIYFRVKTDCDYSSGNYLRAGGTGNIKCGDPVQSYPSISNPLNIKGVSRPYYTLLKTQADTIFPCEKPGKVRVRIINLGPDKTGIEDKYQVILLPGMSFDSALYGPVYNAPDNALTKTRNINGATEVEFSLQDSIMPGDSMEFEFGYQTESKFLNCGSLDLYSQAAVKQEVLCIADNTKCRINVVTGNNLLKTPVVKSDIGFYSLKARIDSTGSDSEYLSLQYNIRNSGSPISASKPLIFNFIYDSNASGTADPGDLRIASDTQYLNLKTSQSGTVNRKIRLKAGQSCALFVMLDSASCSCSFASGRFPVPVLKNAGVSGSICSGDTIKLGTKGVNNFRYVWTPGNELSNDTISKPYAVIANTDSATVSRRFILTTYRGQCTGKDTVLVDVFKLPEINLLQKDTAICDGQKVLLKAASRSGTGAHSIRWMPSGRVSDSSSFSPFALTSVSTRYKAVVTDAKNCRSEDSLFLSIKSFPKAKFVFTETCEGQLLHITDSSSISGDSIVFRRWTAIALDTLNIKKLDLNLNGKLNGSLKLEVRSSFGCTDTFRNNIYLNPLPGANFSVGNRCFGDSVQASDSSILISGSITGYNWNTGDGNTISGRNFKHLYNIPDTFNIILETVSDKNCRDTVSKQVIVYPLPLADFTVPDVCLGDSSIVTNLSSIAGDSISVYRWISGLDTQMIRTPVFGYPKDSVYPVHLLLVSVHACRDSIIKQATVHPNPVSGFKIDNVCELQNSTCTSTATISKGNIAAWRYDLSDGATYSSKDFIHHFNSGDTFDIRLIVSSDQSCKDTITKQHVVYPKLQPDFSFSDVCVSDQVNISDQTTFTNTGIRKWLYKANASDSFFVQNPFFRYAAAGTYTIYQTLTSSEGCVYDTFKQIIVYPLPKVNFADSNKCIDNRFRFYSILSIDTGVIKQVLWDFDDNTGSTLLNPPHSFPSAGIYNVKLIAESDFGCRDSVTKPIVSFPPVTVRFSANNVCMGDVMQFTDLSLTPNSYIKAHFWDFGDGDTAMVQNPAHLYRTPDSFKVRLSVVSGYDCTYDTVQTVEVYPVPVAMFITEPDQATIVNPEISISDLSSGADSIRYDLGDGKFSDMRNLVNSYPDSGTFVIRQFASNSYGCADTFTKRIVIRYMFVFNAPTAFSPNKDGTNDVYAPGGIGLREYSMSIFNRWGEMVYFTDNSTPWDGTYMGEDVMEGVYAVYFKVRDFKGRWHFASTSFVLLR